MGSIKRVLFVCAVLAALPGKAWSTGDRTFASGSLIVPMDLAYQDKGMLQAYGLVFQLLRQGVPVYWVIAVDKVWHPAPCDTAGDLCSWDCAEEGSGEKCAYPTASPDFFAASKVLWDGGGALAAGAAIASHGYRGGPFVVDSADHDRALAIVDAWNDKAQWAANPWAQRSVFQVVTVHEATAEFTGFVRKEMVAAPTIAVFSDGNETIATGYLRAAGIPQSSGAEFPAAKCAAGTCGAGSPNPDMLTVPSVAGDMGTCDAPNLDHKNGQLFKDGVPAYCQIMSMHWNVTDRETVECNGGACPASAAQCAGQPITYHGHEVVAEVRSFLEFPVHFFAECQAVNAYENTTPNPAWPYLDDEGRDGHFLTTPGTPPDCAAGACADADFQCVAKGCDSGGRDCCLPKDAKERGAGYLIATQPASNTIQVLHPEVPYSQMDGAFGTTGGSEPAYNLSTFLGTSYKGSREVTFITGKDGPGSQDVWMTGYVDGTCDITDPGPINWIPSDTRDLTTCTKGKVSYLGGHQYGTAVPVSSNPTTQGTRMFLNALFEADCVTSEGQPQLALALTGDVAVPIATRQGTYAVGFANSGNGTALEAVLSLELPADATVVDAGGGTVQGNAVSFAIGAIGGKGSLSPAASATQTVKVEFAAKGTYTLTARLSYRVGASTLQAPATTLTVGVDEVVPGLDAGSASAGDGGAPVAQADAGGGGGSGASGCGCQAGAVGSVAGGWALLSLFGLRSRRARRSH